MQEDLFGEPYSDDDTSKEMARRMSQLPSTKYYRQAILDLLHRDGPMTDEQIRGRFGIPESSERARRWELAAIGLVKKSSRKIRNSRGNPMVCWECLRYVADVDAEWQAYVSAKRAA